MRGESMKDKSKKSTYSTTFGVDPNNRYSLGRLHKRYSGRDLNPYDFTRRILSPLRLPFRHPSPLKIVEIRSFQSFYPSVNVFSVYEFFSSLKRSMAFYGCLIKKL